MVEEKMTKTQKEKWIERIVVALLSLIVSISFYSFTDKREGDKKLINQVNQLELTKLDKIEFNEKCISIEADFESRRHEMKDDFRGIIEEIKQSQIRMENNSIANQKEMNDKLDRALGLKYIKENR